MSILKLRVATISFLLFFSNFVFGQVTLVDYIIDYDSIKCKYNVCAIITGGETTTAIHKVAFNSSVGLVVPTGATVDLFEENLYWPKNGGVPFPWTILESVISPPSQPQNDFYKITGGSPSYRYQDVMLGDTICLFGLTIGGVDNCGEGIRLYECDVDPPSTAPGFNGKEFKNGFTMGGANQLYDGNRETVGPPKPRLDPISGVDCGPPGLNIDLTPIVDSCKGTFTYNWEGPNVFGETTEDINIPGADLSDGGIYTVTITDALGCKDTIEFQADPKPNAGNDETACGGQTVRLYGNTPNTGSWSQDGINPFGATVNNLSGGEADIDFDANATGEYYFIYDAGVQCTDTVKIDLNAAGSAPDVMHNSPVCEGEDIVITGEDIPGATYVWRFEGTEITSTNSKDLTITASTLSDAGNYSLEVKSGGCASVPADFIIVVNDLPIADAGIDDAICEGEDFTLTASGGNTYQWDGLTPGNDKVVTPFSTTIYSVTVTDGNLCTSTDEVEVTVNSLPFADAGSDDEICEGESLILSANGGTDYSWFDNGTLDNTSIANPEVTPISTTTYTVTVTDGNLCTSTDEVEITVNPLPTADAGFDEAICEGESITLTANGGTDYSWFDDGTLDNTSIANPEVTPSFTTIYIVTVTDGNLCTSTDEVEITVNPLPTANAGADEAICAGESLFLNGSGGGNYVWSPGNDLDDVNVSNPEATLTGTTILTLEVEDSNGCTDTDEVEITVNPLPSISSSATKTTICIGESIDLTAAGADTYEWVDAALTNVGSGTTITLSPTTTTTYTVTGEDSNGCTNTSDITITVNPLPTITASALDTKICIGASTDISAQGGESYDWNNGIGVGNDITITPILTTTYIVTATDVNGCKNTAQLIITVDPLPVVTAAASKPEICVGENATLTATGGTSYDWGVTLGVGNNILVTPIVTTTYSVTATDANGCTNTAMTTITVNDKPGISTSASKTTICIGESTAMTATGGTTYTWVDGAAVNAGSGATITVSPIVTTTYTVTGEDSNGCTNTSDITITVNPIPVITMTAVDNKICLGESTDISAQGGATYMWDNGLGAGNDFTVSPITSTTYKVTATDASGCTNTAQLVINIDPLPVVTATSSNGQICLGEGSTLTATGGQTYEWDQGLGAGNNILVTPTIETTYIVTATDANGCINTATTTVKVNTQPNISTSATNLSICIGESTDLAAAGGNTYTWVDENNNDLGSGETKTVTPNTTTTYTVTGTDSNGCQNISDITVTVNPLPIVSISANDETLCIGEEVSLTATGGDTFTWDPSSVGTGPNVFDIPASSTTYTAIVTDGNGCSSTADIFIDVLPLPNVTVTAAPDVICLGESSTLTATGGNSYDWGADGNTQVITVTPSATRDFNVTVTDTEGCVNTGDVTVTVNTQPNITASATNFSICIGESTDLTASGGNNYEWFDGSTSLSTGDTYTVTPTTTTTYTVEGEDSNGCKNISDVTITVNPLPTVNVSANDETICIGEEVTLTATGGDTYVWNPDVGLSAQVFDFPTIPTTYVVTATDLNGCSNTADVFVNVLPLPIVTVTADPDVLCLGESTSITATGGNSYDWGVDGNTQVISVTPSATQDFNVTVTDTEGCVNTGDVTVTVNTQPNITASATNFSICIGESTDLTASGGSNYQWFDGPTSLGTGTTYTVTPTTTTTYTVEGEDSNGCKNISDVTITVNPLPTVNVSANDETICIGEEVTLTATGGDTYVWNPDVGLSAQVFDFPTVPTDYVVTATDANGCTNTANVFVDVLPLPSVSVTAAPDVICLGETTTLTATGGNSYDWGVDGNSQVISVTPSATRDFNVTVIDTEGCVNTGEVTVTVNTQPNISASASNFSICIGESTDLTASGGSNYEWFDGPTSLATSATYTVTPTTTTTYTVEGEDSNGCKNVSDVTITVNPLPTVNITANDDAICEGEQVTLTATGGDTYVWNPNLGSIAMISDIPSITTTYEVTATDVNGCKNTSSIEISVSPLPTVTAVNDGPYCEGETISLTATGGDSYLWTNNKNTFNASTDTATKSGATVSDSDIYTVVATDANGCSNSSQTTIVVNTNPNATLGADLAICEGEDLSILGPTPSSIGATYSWSFNNSEIATSDDLTLNNIQLSSNGTYTLSVTKDNCSATDEIVVTVNDTPTADAGMDVEFCEGDDVQLTANGGPTYLWSPALGLNDETIANPIANPSSTTTYTVIVEDVNNCKDSDEVLVTVNALPSIDIQNTECSADLSMYSINFISSGTVTVSPSGIVNGNVISDIPANTDVLIRVENSGNSCAITLPVTAPNCDCPQVSKPVFVKDELICQNTPTPELKVTVNAGETVDWYDAPTGGTRLLDNSLTFTSPEVNPGVYNYYAEARNATDNCLSSSRTKVAFTINAVPTITNTLLTDDICSGESSSGFILKGNLPGTTFTWTASTSSVVGATTTGNGNIPAELLTTSASNPSNIIYNVIPSLNGCPGMPLDFEVTVNPLPTIIIDSKDCSADLTTYSITFSASGDVTSDFGTLSGNQITGITADQDVKLTVTDPNSNCTRTIDVSAAACACPPIAAPIKVADLAICEGESNPSLEATAMPGEVIDWYDAMNGGASFFTGPAYTPMPVTTGVYTYYVEARNPVDDCISDARTPITFTINSLPTMAIDSKDCSADFSTYTIVFTTTVNVTPSIGTISGNSLTLNAGEDVIFTITDPSTNCTSTMNVSAPNCSCPTIAAPIKAGDLSICEGENIPQMEASVQAGEIINWYETASSTTILGTGPTYSPITNGPGVYTRYAETSDGLACVSDNRTPVILTINALPTISITSKDCSADKLTYSITFNSNGTVIPDFGTVNGNQIINIPEGQDVIVTTTDAVTNCTITTPVSAVACSCPIIAGPVKVADYTICQQEATPTLEVTSEPGLNVNWYATDISTTSLGSGNTYVPLDVNPGVYTYYAETSDNDGCISDNRTPIRFTINALPTFTLVDRICSADLLTYTATFTTDGTITSVSTGTINGNSIENINSGDAVEITIVNPTTNCTINATISAKTCNCPTVDPPVKVSDLTICENDNIPTLQVVVGNDFDVDWYDKPAGPILLESSSTSFTPSVSSPGVYIYYAEARNRVDGCVSDVRTPVSLTIEGKPNAGSDQTVKCFGTDDATLAAIGNGSWTFGLTAGTAVIEDSNNPNSRVIGFTSAGDYQMIWTVNGCSDTMNIKVGTNCDCTIANNLITPPSTLEFCNTSSDVTIIGSDATPIGGSYRWLYEFNGTSLPISGVSTTKNYKTGALPVGNHQFRRIYTSSTLPVCSDSSNFVEIVVLPQPRAGVDQEFNCVVLQNFNVKAAAQGIGKWSQSIGNPQQISIDDETNPISDFTGFNLPGTYTFTWTNGICFDEFVVDITKAANAGVDPDSVECIMNSSILLNALDANGYWTANNSNPGESTIMSPDAAKTVVTGFTNIGTYVYTWTSEGCSDEVVGIIMDNCPCEIASNNIVPPFESTYCLNSGELLIVGEEATPSGGKYLWEYSIDGGSFKPLPNVNDQKDYTVDNFGPAKYQLRRTYSIEGFVPCADVSNIVNILVYSDEIAPGPVQISDSDPVCIGDTVNLYIDPVEGITYNWVVMSGGVQIVSQSLSSITLLAQSSGIVTVGVTQTYDLCESATSSPASTIDFIIHPNANPNLGVDTTYCEFNEIYQLDAGEFVTYLWEDGTTDRYRDIEEKGTYSVEVIDENGCVGNDAVNLKEFCCEFANPNIINLTSQVDNNKFKITDIYDCAKQSQLYIYDRWGNLVFQSEDGINACWDGKFNGQPVAQGVYVFVLKFQGLDENDQEFEDDVSGDVTVIR